MPVLGTLGALSYDKVPLTSGNAYWMINTQTLFKSSTFFDSALWLVGAPISSPQDGIVFKISQDFSPSISLQNNFAAANISVDPKKIIGSASGNLTIVGGDQRAFIGKLDGGATFNTSKKYAGTTIAGTEQFRENNCVAYDTLGNYYVAGWTRESVAVGYAMFLSKFDGVTNALIWTKVGYQAGAIVTDPSSGQDNITIKVDSANNILLMYQRLASTPAAQDYLKLLKFSSTTGSVLSQIRFTGGGAGADYGSFALDQNDNIYIIYRNGSAAFPQLWPTLVKYNSSFVLQWSVELSNTANIAFQLIDSAVFQDIPIQIYNNNIYLTMWTASGTPLKGYLMSIDFNGNLNWSTITSYYISGTSQLVRDTSLLVTNSGLYRTFNTSTNDAHLVKLPIDGSVPGTGNYTVTANSYMTYANGDVIVTSNTPIATSAGNLTVITASTTNVDNITLSTSNTISSYTTISL